MYSFLLICFIAGGIGATLQGMIGIGTGLILVPLLTFLLPYYDLVSSSLAIHVALATAMAAVATNSITAVSFHYLHGNINWELCKKIILFSISGAIFGALVVGRMSGTIVQVMFACILILISIYMLFKRQPMHDNNTSTHSNIIITLGGFGIGLIASIVGSGGGIVMVPFLHALKLSMRYAVGTSSIIGLPIALTGTLVYIWIGLPAMTSNHWTIGYLCWPAYLAIVLAGMISAPLGVKYATKMNANFLRKLFSILLILIGIKMIYPLWQ